MKKYAIKVERWVRYAATVEVFAESAREARELALATADLTSGEVSKNKTTILSAMIGVVRKDYPERDGRVFFEDPRCVAVLFDPEGGCHPCQTVGGYNGEEPLYWCGGLMAKTPGELADRIHRAWYAPCEPQDLKYARQEASFGEGA